MPRQLIELLDSTGRVEATAQGMGTITPEGAVDITVNVIRANLATPQQDLDAGTGAMGVPYKITGIKTGS